MRGCGKQLQHQNIAALLIQLCAYPMGFAAHQWDLMILHRCDHVVETAIRCPDIWTIVSSPGLVTTPSSGARRTHDSLFCTMWAGPGAQW